MGVCGRMVGRLSVVCPATNNQHPTTNSQLSTALQVGSGRSRRTWTKSADGTLMPHGLATTSFASTEVSHEFGEYFYAKSEVFTHAACG